MDPKMEVVMDISNVPIPATMRWTIKKLHGRHYIVDTRSNPKIDWPEGMDEDPFGPNWKVDLAIYLARCHCPYPDFWQVTEILSAQRVSHPDMFGYHMYFAAILGELPMKAFAEVFISRKDMTVFVPEVTCLNIFWPDQKVDYNDGCHYCRWWVPHPKGMRTIRFDHDPDYTPLFDRNNPLGSPVCKNPWRSYVSPNVRRAVPIDLCQMEFIADVADPKMFTSGIRIDDDCKLKFLELKTKRISGCIIFKMEKHRVFVDKFGICLEVLPDALSSVECRYIVIDFDSKIIFVEWSPEKADCRSKLDYYHSREIFKRELDGIQVDVKATSHSELGNDFFSRKCPRDNELHHETMWGSSCNVR